ncbi:hypothetical protein L905_20755 [Agrobacterium sp. TS43]|nr:hypothetical protein L905_20755 [Agrobacterium sp. TS43]
MAGVTDGAVIHGPHLAFQRGAERAEAARGVERLVGNAVERKFLTFLQRRNGGKPAFDDRFAGLDIFVDQPVRAPGEVVVERIGRILRQSADAHPHAVQLVELGGKIGGDDGDEAGGEAALRDERRLGRFCQSLDLAGGFDVFGEIEIMRADGDRRFGNARRQVEGGGGEHGEFAFQQCFQSGTVGDVDDFGINPFMRRHIGQLIGRTVGDGDAIIA